MHAETETARDPRRQAEDPEPTAISREADPISFYHTYGRFGANVPNTGNPRLLERFDLGTLIGDNSDRPDPPIQVTTEPMPLNWIGVYRAADGREMLTWSSVATEFEIIGALLRAEVFEPGANHELMSCCVWRNGLTPTVDGSDEGPRLLERFLVDDLMSPMEIAGPEVKPEWADLAVVDMELREMVTDVGSVLAVLLEYSSFELLIWNHRLSRADRTAILNARMDAPLVFEPGPADPPPTTMPEEEAPRQVIPVEEIAKAGGIATALMDFPDDLKAVDGVCFLGRLRSNGPNPDKEPLIALNRSRSASRMRFTLGHELAHCAHALAGAIAPEDLVTNTRVPSPTSPKERLCNEVSAQTCMPADVLVNEIAAGRGDVFALAATFGTSLTATRVRLRKLGLLSARQLSPEEIAEVAGVEVRTRQLPEDCSDIDGALVTIRGRRAIILNADNPQSRRRFTAAHKLAHLARRVSGRWSPSEAVDERADGPMSPEELSEERLCDRIAAEVIMPCDILLSEILRAGKVHCFSLARHFSVSVTAMRARLHGLGLL